MKHRLLFAASIAALGLAACSKQPETTATETVAVPSESTDVAATPTVSAGQVFADTAAASDAFEIETSRLAATKASSAKVKQYAQEMIKAHTESTAKLKDAAAQASPAITPEPALNAAQQQTLTDLGGKTGAGFDKAYAAAQVTAHQMTLDALKGYSAGGDVASLKTFATSLVPIVTAHLNMAKML
ncbi:hypothetical protein WSK_1547 [Novosphingobium sp. Rr 2-17]|uniref:DUF4142 domain-containing protein n=1 Tax=Novosphingobium sp. Rr 2-17 TaxID=555793 RepID=UPI0002699512|nr:DUF4142 domain-containing protein [Novosphingobium sp. Rr 2-17]EIZ79871.1 hypothetical protein WSK_1547 [Novosphingobium sp. Rr 2-17]